MFPRAQQVLDALAELGPSTSLRIAHHLRASAGPISAAAARLAEHRPRSRRQIHIASWAPANAPHAQPRPVYAIGDLPDAPPPRGDRA